MVKSFLICCRQLGFVLQLLQAINLFSAASSACCWNKVFFIHSFCFSHNLYTNRWNMKGKQMCVLLGSSLLQLDGWSMFTAEWSIYWHQDQEQVIWLCVHGKYYQRFVCRSATHKREILIHLFFTIDLLSKGWFPSSFCLNSCRKCFLKSTPDIPIQLWHLVQPGFKSNHITETALKFLMTIF